MFELWSAPEVCEYSGSAEDFEGRAIALPAKVSADSDRILDFFIRHQQQGTAFRWAMILQDDACFAGAVGFNALGECSEIAYHLVPRYWGRGLMSEACRAAISWVAAEFGSRSVEAFVEPDNVRSCRLIHKLKFAPSGESVAGADRYLLVASDLPT
jgi:ribosomal-protein-alanine N-acetyltransferase